MNNSMDGVPYSKRVTLATSVPSPQRRITHYMSSQKLYGVTSADVTPHSNFGAYTGNSPSLPWFWNIWWNNRSRGFYHAGTPIGETEIKPAAITMTVGITYYTEFCYRLDKPADAMGLVPA